MMSVTSKQWTGQSIIQVTVFCGRAIQLFVQKYTDLNDKLTNGKYKHKSVSATVTLMEINSDLKSKKKKKKKKNLTLRLV